MPDHIFTYGSLVDVERLGEFLGRSIKPEGWRVAQLRGFRRCWNVAMDNRIDLPGYKYYVERESGVRPEVFVTFLNIRPLATDRVNGVLFRVESSELLGIDKRERNYTRIDVAEFFDADVDGPVWAYQGSPDALERYARARTTETAVIDADYHRQVLAAFRNLGEDAMKDFERTTDPSSTPTRRLRRMRIP